MHLFDAFVSHARTILHKAVLLLSLPAFKMCYAVVLFWIDSFTKYTGINVAFEVSPSDASHRCHLTHLCHPYWNAFRYFVCAEKSRDDQHQRWTRENLHFTSTKAKIHRRNSWTEIETSAGGFHIWCVGTPDSDHRNGSARAAQAVAVHRQSVPQRFRIGDGIEHKHFQSATPSRPSCDSLWQRHLRLRSVDAVGCVPAIDSHATGPHLLSHELGSDRLHRVQGELPSLFFFFPSSSHSDCALSCWQVNFPTRSKNTK